MVPVPWMRLRPLSVPPLRWARLLPKPLFYGTPGGGINKAAARQLPMSMGAGVYFRLLFIAQTTARKHAIAGPTPWLTACCKKNACYCQKLQPRN